MLCHLTISLLALPSAHATPVFTSEAAAGFTRTVAGTFSAAASGAPTYSVDQKTFASSDFTMLPDGWTLLTSAQVTGGAGVLNPATASTNGAFILPKLGASSPGSFTASFDFTVANVIAAAGTQSGTSFNYGVISGTTGSATNMTGSNGLAIGFLEATNTVPASVEVRWNSTVIGKAPITFGTGAKAVQIKLDGANYLTVSYDGTKLIDMNLAGKVNAADRSNYQFGLGASNTTPNPSSHTIDNLAIVSNGVLPTGLALDANTGVISGTATTTNAAGTQVFNLVATNANGTSSQQFSLNLASGGPVFTTPATQPMLPGVATTFAVAAPGSGGATTYSVAPQTFISTTLANSGTLPAGAYRNGSAQFNAGALELTQNVASQTGSVQFLGQGAQNPTAFSASFSYKVGGGTTVGGTGISFNYGAPGDNTKGLRVDFTELTSGANTNLTVTAYAGVTLLSPATTIPNPFLNNYNFVPVSLRMSAEGRVQVWVNNVLAVDAGTYTGWQTTDKSQWAFGFTGTTGASNNNFHTIKNLVIGTNGILPPGLSFDTTTGVISGKVGIGTAVDEYVNVTASNAAGTAMQLLKLDVSASNTLPGQRPGTGTSIGGPNALGAAGKQFRNLSAFAALTTDGAVKVWGNTANGGLQSAAPTGTGYVSITSNEKAFAALKNDGSIFCWGDSTYGGSNSGSGSGPTGKGWAQIFATRSAFAAIKNDGSVIVWGNTANGGTFSQVNLNSPTGTGYIRIFANGGAFAAQKADGTIKTWGNTNSIGTSSTPVALTTAFSHRVTVNDFLSSAASYGAFATTSNTGANTGTISAWGSTATGTNTGATGKPTAIGWLDIVNTSRAFATIDTNGFITSWGDSAFGGANGVGPAAYLKAPTDSGYRQLYGNSAAFVAVRQDGSLTSWGSSGSGGTNAPTGTDYLQVFSTLNSFAGLKADGSISVWGSSLEGNKASAPTDTGYVNIFSSQGAFAAIKADGSVTAWGDTTMGGSGGPTGTGWSEVTTTGTAFTARKSDGSLYSWGNSANGGTGTPTGSNYLTVQSPTLAAPYFPLAAGAPTTFVTAQSIYTQIFLGIQGDGLLFQLSGGTLPTGMVLDANSGWIIGTPVEPRVFTYEPRVFTFEVTATGAAGSVVQDFNLVLTSSALPNQRQGSGAVYTMGSGQEFSNAGAFAGIAANGSIVTWGSSLYGGSGAPIDTGYTKITSNERAFAALRWDGRITAWGDTSYGGSGAPTGTGYTAISSTISSFAALKADGSITAWGSSLTGGTGAPTGTGYTKIYASSNSFAAIKADGSITTWGDTTNNTGAPTGTGYVSITPNVNAYAALKADGSITAWGISTGGGTGAPTGTGYTKVVASNGAFAALRPTGTTPDAGSIAVWGNSSNGGTGGPSGTDFVDVWASSTGFAAMRSDGSLVSWGASGTLSSINTPTGTGFTQVFSTGTAFAAMKTDGSIVAWGNTANGGTGAPAGTGYTTIYSTGGAFAALKADGTITAWGNTASGGSGAPTGTGYVRIYAMKNAFAAIKADGTVDTWGAAASISGAGLTPVAGLQGTTEAPPYFTYGITGNLPSPRLTTSLATQAAGLSGPAGYQVGAFGVGVGSFVTSGSLPDGVTLNLATGYLEGTPTRQGTSNFTVTSYNESGQASQAYSLTVMAATTTTVAPVFDTTKPIGFANYAVGKSATYDLAAVATPSNLGSSLNYSRIAGTLPPGMINTISGSVTGTPTVPGTYRFTLTASDKNGIAAQTFTILVSGDTPNQRPGQSSSIDAQSSGSQGLNEAAFAALRANGTIVTWGDSAYGGAGAAGVPTGAGYVHIAQTARAFAAVRYDGSIQAWGDAAYGGTGAPSGTGYTRLFSNASAFAAMKADGSITVWGKAASGGFYPPSSTASPTGTGYTQIFSRANAFAAMKADGTVKFWGSSSAGLQGASGQVAFASIENATAVVPARQFAVTGNLPAARQSTSLAVQATNLNGVAGFQVGANTGLGLGSAITSGSLPDGLTLNVATGFLEGTASKVGTSNFTVSTSNGTGQSSQDYSGLGILEPSRMYSQSARMVLGPSPSSTSARALRPSSSK